MSSMEENLAERTGHNKGEIDILGRMTEFQKQKKNKIE